MTFHGDGSKQVQIQNINSLLEEFPLMEFLYHIQIMEELGPVNSLERPFTHLWMKDMALIVIWIQMW